MMGLDLFIGGFFQAIVVALNVRNISAGKIIPAIFTAFVLAVIWGYVVREIVRDMDGFWHIMSYAMGVSIGTGIGVYLSKKKFFLDFMRELGTEMKQDIGDFFRNGKGV